MAVSLKTAGAWARLVVDGTVAIPGSPAAGDRMFLFATWKTYTITVTDPSGWTPIGTEFADGAVAAGNGAGSVKVMAWYRDWQSGDGAPTINWSVDPTEGHAVIMLWQKGAGESWNTPLTVTAAMTNWTTTSRAVAASATVAVADGDVVMGLISIRDDSTTMTRPTTGIDDSGGLITWNGNYVESPATHFNSTTGLDMSGDLGHRFVTTGATATLRMTGTISAAETGAGKWVVQGVFTSDPKTATPTTASLTTTKFAPTVTASDNKAVVPGTASLTATRFAPTVTATANQLLVPSTATLTATRFAPVVTASDHQMAVPGTAGLTLATFAPTVTATDNRVVVPGPASLLLTALAASVVIGLFATPATASLTTTAFAPTVTASDHVAVVPGTASISLATFAPSVGLSVTATPGTAALTLTSFVPTVTFAGGQIATPGAASLSLATFSPTILLPVAATPAAASLTTTQFPPTVSVTVLVVPGTASIALTGFAPNVSVDPRASLPTEGKTMGVKMFGVDLAKASEASGVAGVGADIASANTIAPTDGVHAVTGTGLVKTITPPSWLPAGGQIRLIPEGAFTSDTTGNIGLASTAVVGVTLTMTWDGTKFWPSY